MTNFSARANRTSRKKRTRKTLSDRGLGCYIAPLSKLYCTRGEAEQCPGRDPSFWWNTGLVTARNGMAKSLLFTSSSFGKGRSRQKSINLPAITSLPALRKKQSNKWDANLCVTPRLKRRVLTLIMVFPVSAWKNRGEWRSQMAFIDKGLKNPATPCVQGCMWTEGYIFIA